MYSKAEYLKMLKNEFDNWDNLLSHTDEKRATTLEFGGYHTIKDIVGHLTAWQELTLARLNAALAGTDPIKPVWLKGGDPDHEPNIDQYNETIYMMYQRKTWDEVYKEWKNRYQEVLKMVEKIAETDLMAEEKYAWLKEYPLMAVLSGTLEHHKEHYRPLLEWLLGHGEFTDVQRL